MEATYAVVIIPGSGDEMSIVTAENCTDDSCSYIFSSDGITDSYSVAVDVVGCITERINCINLSSCKLHCVHVYDISYWNHFLSVGLC